MLMDGGRGLFLLLVFLILFCFFSLLATFLLVLDYLGPWIYAIISQVFCLDDGEIYLDWKKKNKTPQANQATHDYQIALQGNDQDFTVSQVTSLTW